MHRTQQLSKQTGSCILLTMITMLAISTMALGGIQSALIQVRLSQQQVIDSLLQNRNESILALLHKDYIPGMHKKGQFAINEQQDVDINYPELLTSSANDNQLHFDQRLGESSAAITWLEPASSDSSVTGNITENNNLEDFYFEVIITTSTSAGDAEATVIAYYQCSRPTTATPTQTSTIALEIFPETTVPCQFLQLSSWRKL